MLSKIAIVALLIAWAPLANAQPDKARAREYYREATQHYKLGEYTEALAAFKLAYRSFEDPSFLFNIGQCLRQLNEKQEAIRFYKTYLHDAPNTPDREEVEHTIAMLQDALEKENAAKKAPPPATQLAQPSEATSTTTKPTTTAPALVATSSAPPTRRPVYKRWWLWTAVGVVVAAGAVGLGVGLSQAPSAPMVMTTNGTFKPF